MFTGFSDGTFHPDEELTRVQFIMVLWKLAKSPGADMQAAFIDTPSDAYYIDTMKWGVEKGLINGMENEGVLDIL